MSAKHVRTTGDLVRFRCAARIECRDCFATRTLSAVEMTQAFGVVPLDHAEARLKCARCGKKVAKLVVLPPV